MPLPLRAPRLAHSLALVASSGSSGSAARAHCRAGYSKPAVWFAAVRDAQPRTAAVAVAVAHSQPTAGSLDEDDAGLEDLPGFDGGPPHVEAVHEASQLQPLEATQCGIMFRLHFQSRPGQQVLVTGSDPSLGDWDPQHALRLQWHEGDVWAHEEPVLLLAGQQLQYKYVVLSNQRAQQLWSSGENLHLDVPGMGGCWTLQDAWQVPSNHVVQEGMAPEACVAAVSAAAAGSEAGSKEVAAPASCEADPRCEQHAVGTEYPVPIKYKCFLCGQCMQPHLHERSCPRGFSDADVERVFKDTIAGAARGEHGRGGVDAAQQ